jgi:hypothetical protein
MNNHEPMQRTTRDRLRRGWAIVGGVVLGLGVIACGLVQPSVAPTPARSTLKPPPTFHERDLFGRWEWQSVFGSTEVLTLTADGQFVQVYEEGDPAKRYETSGTWWVDLRPSGCVWVHLDGMRYFHGGRVLAEQGNRLPPDGMLLSFVEKCEGQTITMPDKVILSVTDRPQLPRGIGLLFPKSGRENTDASMLLTADTAGTPLPWPTAPPR